MNPLPQQRALPLQIDIQTQSPLWDAQPLAARTIRDAIGAASTMLSTAGGEVSIVLTNDTVIRDLNRDWRGIDKSTNVLSFPASDLRPAGETRLLGDIIIAFETLERECGEEKRIFLHHLAHLAVHGFLHLLGYDHQSDAAAEAMEALERKILARLGIPDPYGT